MIIIDNGRWRGGKVNAKVPLVTEQGIVVIAKAELPETFASRTRLNATVER